MYIWFMINFTHNKSINWIPKPVTLLVMCTMVMGCLVFIVYSIRKLKLNQEKANERIDILSEAIAKNQPKND